VLLAERVDRRVEREHDERDARPERDAAPARHRATLRGQRAAAPVIEQRRDDRGNDLERLERPGREERRGIHVSWKTSDGPVHLFHYHLVTSELRDVEARYVGRLGFELVARYGRIGDEHVSVEPGVSWEKLEQDGFKLRLSELERGAVNVVVQPGHWRVPRVDHIGIALDEDDFQSVLGRAMQWNLRVQEHGGRRTFVATNAGYRLEVHPPREWIDELLENKDELRVAELQLRADEPDAKAGALADLLGLEAHDNAVDVGGSVVRFVEGGPEGRPELYGERFG
jgi:hypothetical protein